MTSKDLAPGLAREHIRAVNTKAVLDAIHQQGQASRTSLAVQVGLSQAALTDITGELVRHGIVFEAREGKSATVGRKPIMLQINYDFATVMGVKVTNRFITSVLTDLKTTVLAVHDEPISDHEPETVLDAIERSAGVLAGKTEAAGRLVAAAITLPGIVDPQAGTNIYSALLGWHDLPAAGLLQERLNVPVIIDNDVNAIAAAEASFGHGLHHDSFLIVTLGRGVGLGIVLEGRVYRGPFGGAGEFGHVSLDPAGPECSCGNRGCVETYISDPALLEAARRVLPDITDLTEFTRLAAAGNEALQQVFRQAGTRLGFALSHLVNIFAPTLIILGGEGMRAAELIVPAAREALLRNSFGNLAGNVEVIVETWGDDAWAQGAAGLAASRFLADVAWEITDSRPTPTRQRPAL